MDIKIYVIRKVTDRFISGISIVVTLAVFTLVSRRLAGGFPGYSRVQPTYMIFVGCAFVIFLVSEFSDYLTHYMEHRIPILWELHKVHHSALFLNPLTAQRGHPAAFIFERATSGLLTGLPAGLFGFLFNLNLVDIVFLGACATKIGTIGTLDSLKHSHFPVSFGWLDRVLISPHMHHLHHSRLVHHWDRNFGTNLSIWDWLFGTAYKPSKNEEIIYGISNLDEQPDYDSLKGVYIGPLVKMWRLLKKRWQPALPDITDGDIAKSEIRSLQELR